MKNYIISAILFIAIFVLPSWGFFAHQKINYHAVFTLPSGMIRFYKANITYLSEHAVDADKRRYADSLEAPRHYLDVELYEEKIDSIPERWDKAVKRYGEAKMNKAGILPWQIQKTYNKLVEAFKNRDSSKILIHSAYLGHYIADAHVPLHTTQNHNGQLTNQIGIHAFWESRLPELFHKKYKLLTGRAIYLESPLNAAWSIVKHTNSLVDSTLSCEKKVSVKIKSSQLFEFSKRNHALTRQYSYQYSNAYHNLMNGMVERQMRKSIFDIGSFWYTAWVDAGQPTLEGF